MHRVAVMVAQYFAASYITYYGVMYVLPPSLYSVSNLISDAAVVFIICLVASGAAWLRPDMSHSVTLGVAGAAVAIVAAELLIYGLGKLDWTVPYGLQPAMSVVAAVLGYWLAIALASLLKRRPNATLNPGA